jgi:S-formylglutathione hydrolase FrmB
MGFLFLSMNRFPLIISALLLSICSYAATVDTVTIYSNAMQKEYKCVVIKPSVVQNETIPLPVVYLLHGHGGWYANWVLRVPQLKEYADQYRLIIVCPDGGYNSWYFNSPVDASIRFETYISEEVPTYIDAHYPTIKDRKARAITGLSMGGHGGLFLGFRHATTFGACGSMSGGVDLRPFYNNWQLKEKLGDTISHAANWKNYSVTNVVEQAPAQPLSIIIDCGTEDFFYAVNHALHEKLLQLKIAHEYIERPGQHNWDYWGNAVKYQLLYFSNYFKSAK